MADGLDAKLRSYLSDFSLEFGLKIWHSYYLGNVVLISGEIRKSIFSSETDEIQTTFIQDLI